MRPRLLIQYSDIYDRRICEWQKLDYKYTFKKGTKYTKKLQKEWDGVGARVFKIISKVSGLNWQKPIIDCYVVQKVVPFSMPLTISINNNIKNQIEIIIHELIHNIVVQNHNKINKKGYSKKYGKLNKKTKIHVLIHAILKETLIEIYGENQTKKFIKKYDKWPDYKKAWDIVDEEGPKSIIKNSIK